MFGNASNRVEMELLMELVICMITLLHGDYREGVEITAPAIHTDSETWLLDLTMYFNEHPELKGDHNLIIPVNSGDCRFK